MIETVSPSKKGKILAYTRYQIAKGNENEHQIVSRHNDKLKTDALDMIMSNIQENDQTTINAPTNTLFVQSMPTTTQLAIQQKQDHIQTQIQEYERKNEICMRFIDKTTLRIYFPRNPNADLLISTSEPLCSTLSSSCDQDEATRTQGPPLVSLAFSPSLPSMLHDSIWLHYI